MTKQFRHFDTKRADGSYVTFERITVDDESSGSFYARDVRDVLRKLRENDEGMTLSRAQAFARDEWRYIGVQARAHIHIIQNGAGTYYTLTSAGLWGIESDSGEDYLNEVFDEEKNALTADLAAMWNLIEEAPAP